MPGQHQAEHLEINAPIQSLKRVTRRRQPLQMIRKIKQSNCVHPSYLLKAVKHIIAINARFLEVSRLRKAYVAGLPLFGGPVEAAETYMCGQRKHKSNAERSALKEAGAGRTALATRKRSLA